MRAFASCLSALALAAVAAGAMAHPQPRSALPAPMAMIALSPAEIRMTFSEPLIAGASGLELRDAHGQDITLGPVAIDPVDPRQIFAPIPGKLPPGTYTVRWHAVGADRRPAKGDYMFEMR